VKKIIQNNISMPSAVDFILNKVMGNYKCERVKVNSTVYKCCVKGVGMAIYFFFLKTFSVSVTFTTLHYCAHSPLLFYHSAQ